MYENILVGLDLESESDIPFLSGRRMAAEYGANLRVVSVVRTSLLLGKGFFNAELVDRDELVQEAKSALMSRISKDGPVASDVQIGKPSEVISKVADFRQSDLIVIGAKARSKAESIFGTTATNILSQIDKVDLYACHRLDPENPIERVVIALDGSAISDEVLAKAHQMITSKLTHTETNVRLVTVLDGNKRHSQKVKSSVEDHVSKSAFGQYPLEYREGDVIDCLNDVVVDYDVDLLVVGSGYHWAATWYIGSTSNNVLHECSCDVLVVRS